MINFSVIIPHKNIPKLLQRCLDSIPQRDDLEVIIVDDNSDPNIVDFEHFPGLNRKDTTVIFDKTGKGAGRARNVGLDHAKGNWLLFADSDDYFNYCLSDILKEYLNDDSDIVYFLASSVDSETYLNVKRSEEFNFFLQEYLGGKIKYEWHIRYVLASPWSKLIKRRLIFDNGIKCEETTKHNDIRLCYLMGYYAKKIKVDGRAIYCVTYRSASITHTITKEKVLDAMRVMARKDCFFKEHDIQVPKGYNRNFFPALVNVAASGDVELYEQCLEELSKFGIPVKEERRLVRRELEVKKKTIIDKVRQMIALRTRFRRFFALE